MVIPVHWSEEPLLPVRHYFAPRYRYRCPLLQQAAWTGVGSKYLFASEHVMND